MNTMTRNAATSANTVKMPTRTCCDHRLAPRCSERNRPKFAPLQELLDDGIRRTPYLRHRSRLDDGTLEEHRNTVRDRVDRLQVVRHDHACRLEAALDVLDRRHDDVRHDRIES